MREKLEAAVESALFSSRWILAPFYLGMVLSLAAILVVFAHDLLTEMAQIRTMDGEQVILLSLSQIDLSLTANLLLIVIFSGYENFVSKMRVGEHEDRPSWMGAVDFSGMKIKLIASIIAISAIALLRMFLLLGEPAAKVDAVRIRWMLAIHLTFVVSGVLLATMDRLAGKRGSHAAEG